jgi:hypothetical protein
VNARKKALLKYGFYGAEALVCAALAALGSFRVFPLVTGPGRPVFLGGVALVMILQSAAHLRTKRQDCFIVRREELMGSSFILFVGAALLLALLATGCSPAKAKEHTRQVINFYGTESTGYWSMFGADAPGSFAAQEMPWRTQKSNQTACRRMRSCRLAALGSQSLRCSKPRQRVCAGRN